MKKGTMCTQLQLTYPELWEFGVAARLSFLYPFTLYCLSSCSRVPISLELGWHLLAYKGYLERLRRFSWELLLLPPFLRPE